MISDEQIRVSERRHFVDNARNLAQSSEARSQPRHGRHRSHVERDLSSIAIVLAFVLPGLLLGAWSARLYLADVPTDVQAVLYQNGLFWPHSQHAAFEAARESFLRLPLWCLTAAVSVLLIAFAPLVNLLRTVRR